jgi:hypothetical protein
MFSGTNACWLLHVHEWYGVSRAEDREKKSMTMIIRYKPVITKQAVQQFPILLLQGNDCTDGRKKCTNLKPSTSANATLQNLGKS